MLSINPIVSNAQRVENSAKAAQNLYNHTGLTDSVSFTGKVNLREELKSKLIQNYTKKIRELNEKKSNLSRQLEELKGSLAGTIADIETSQATIRELQNKLAAYGADSSNIPSPYYKKLTKELKKKLITIDKAELKKEEAKKAKLEAKERIQRKSFDNLIKKIKKIETELENYFPKKGTDKAE